MVYDDIVQSTANNSNLQGKLKKVQVIGSLKQITRRKEMGWGGGGGGEEYKDVHCTSRPGSKIILQFKKNKAWLISTGLKHCI